MSKNVLVQHMWRPCNCFWKLMQHWESWWFEACRMCSACTSSCCIYQLCPGNSALQVRSTYNRPVTPLNSPTQARIASTLRARATAICPRGVHVNGPNVLHYVSANGVSQCKLSDYTPKISAKGHQLFINRDKNMRLGGSNEHMSAVRRPVWS